MKEKKQEISTKVTKNRPIFAAEILIQMHAIKNIAIIAHVDHGKTTLVDKIMHHCELFRSNENKGELILDNNDLERERGITISIEKYFGYL